MATESEKPCCPAAAARMTKKLNLGDGFPVGIVNLDNILKEVVDMKLADNQAIKRELLERVKGCNYVAPGAEADYASALFREYRELLGRQA